MGGLRFVGPKQDYPEVLIVTRLASVVDARSLRRSALAIGPCARVPGDSEWGTYLCARKRSSMPGSARSCTTARSSPSVGEALAWDRPPGEGKPHTTPGGRSTLATGHATLTTTYEATLGGTPPSAGPSPSPTVTACRHRVGQ